MTVLTKQSDLRDGPNTLNQGCFKTTLTLSTLYSYIVKVNLVWVKMAPTNRRQAEHVNEDVSMGQESRTNIYINRQLTLKVVLSKVGHLAHVH
jgi:hypothetical protein